MTTISSPWSPLKNAIRAALVACAVLMTAAYAQSRADDTQARAQAGDPDAQYTLGVRYHSGVGGVGRDFKEAARWYLLAANQGHLSAQFWLGFLLYHGIGVPKDDVAAVKWFRRAAQQRSPDDLTGSKVEAQNSLGAMLANGEGVDRDLVEAYKWFNLAAAQGNEMAIVNRDGIAKQMTREQIAIAQKRSADWASGQPR